MNSDFNELFIRFPGFRTRAVTFSYDDGVYQDRRLVETFNRYGLKCTFNLNSGLMGVGNRLTEEEAAHLYDGHEVAVHTYTHPHLDNLDTAQVSAQVTADREKLESIFGCLVEGMAYPYYLPESPAHLAAISACGIRYARTTDATGAFRLPQDPLRLNPTCHHSDPRFPALCEEFFKPDDLEHPWRITAKLFYIWGHSYEFDDKWDELEKICQAVSGHEEVWYATNGEIIDYADAFKKLRRTIDGKKVYNPTDRTLYVRAANKDLVLAPGSVTEI